MFVFFGKIVSVLGFSSRKEIPPLQGDLSVITIDNLMQLVSHAALSGELKLTALGNCAVFSVDRGTLVYAYLENNPTKIGQQLIRENYITPEQLEESLSHYETSVPRLKIGEVLVQKGYLRQKDLEVIIKEQIKSIFFEVLSWKKGAFSFSLKTATHKESIYLDERIDHLILEGIVSQDRLAQ